MELRRTGVGLLAVAAMGLMTSGCATEAYVDQQIATVNGRIEQLGGQVTQLSGRVDANASGVQAAQTRADEAHKLAEGKLVYSVLSDSDYVSFDTNKWKLSSEAQATLTAFADRLKSENRNVYIEIVGNGDSRGSVMSNRILGEKRALEVRRFLTAQGLPLGHMETVSWGEERQVQQGTSAEAMAANRRVTLRVLG